MRSEIQWPGDAIAAPFCRAYGREDAYFDSIGARSWNRTYDPSDRAGADPAPVVLIDGFVLSAAALRPEFFPPVGEPAHHRNLGRDRLDDRHADTALTDFGWRRPWITSISSIFAELRSRMLRGREIRRIRAAWQTIDDRTLRDIGISRHEIDYGGAARHARGDDTGRAL
jgi:uncharacterized protein YjiS (DUF1127 family)